MTACVLYAAKSTVDERGSLASQLASCRAHAERQGWRVVAEYHDEAASGFKQSRGPGLVHAKDHAAASAAEHGECVLLVYASDRLARGDAKTAAHLVEHVLDGMKQGYRIESVTEDLGGQMALVLAALYGERAHADSAAKSEHTKAGKRRAAERGRRNGGPRPYGYRHVARVIDGVPSSALELVPHEAKIVRRIFEAVADGASQATVARELNADGVKTVRGAAWSQSRVGQMLRNPLYRGMVRHKSDFFPGLHEPIVSEELWQAVEQVRTRATRSRGNGGGRPPRGNHLLTGGLLRCSCGAAMRARTQQKKHGVWEAYLCNGRHSGSTTCNLPAISREEIDRAVWHYFATVGLDSAAMAREWEERRCLRLAELSTRISEAERDAKDAEARLDRVRRDYLRGALTAEHWKGFKAELEPERQAAAAALDRLKAHYETVHNEAAAGDSEAETLAALQDIRDTLAGIVASSADIPAARQALGRLFESFTFYQYEHAAQDMLDADLASGDWYILPTVKTDALLVPRVVAEDEYGEPTMMREQELRKTSIPVGEKLSASPR